MPLSVPLTGSEHPLIPHKVVKIPSGDLVRLWFVGFPDVTFVTIQVRRGVFDRSRRFCWQDKWDKGEGRKCRLVKVIVKKQREFDLKPF